jgi:hypothetical protein
VNGRRNEDRAPVILSQDAELLYSAEWMRSQARINQGGTARPSESRPLSDEIFC